MFGAALLGAWSVQGCLLPEIGWQDPGDGGISIDGDPLQPSNGGQRNAGTGGESGSSGTGGTDIGGGGTNSAGSGGSPSNSGSGNEALGGAAGNGASVSEMGGSGGAANPDGGAGSGGAQGTSTCIDGIKNGFETGVDCGGGCGLCTVGKECTVNQQCFSGNCGTENCAPLASCCQQSQCSNEPTCVPGTRRCGDGVVEGCDDCGRFVFERNCLACDLTGPNLLCL